MRTFARDRLVFNVRDEGPEQGTAVVLLHGFPQDSTAWDGVVGDLHRAGYRTLAPDQRGYSPGARPHAVRAYRIRETATDVIALLDACELERAHVVGHDWGGAVAWAVASEWPDRVSSLTSLSMPHPSAMRAALWRGTQALRSWYVGLFQVPWLSEHLLRPGGPAWRAMLNELPPHQAHHYTQRMDQPGALSAALNWYRVLPRETVNPSLSFKSISVPTRYIWGDRDPTLGRTAAEATGDFVTGDYAFVILPDVGHWVPETAPSQVSQLLVEHVQEVDLDSGPNP